MIRYDIEGAVAVVTIDDEKRRNPLTNEAMSGLRQAVERAGADPAVQAVVITGAGDRSFCAGGDLDSGFVDQPLASHGARGALADLFRSMRRCATPIVGRVNGHALGGGFGLAAACDITVAADHGRFGMPEVNVGLWPMMISAVIADVMPRKAAIELMLTGRLIDAEEARALGVVTSVVPLEQLDEAVDGVTTLLASKSPAVVGLGKDAFYAITDMKFDDALDYLQTGLTAVSMTEDALEGVTAFKRKRDPEWSGR